METLCSDQWYLYANQVFKTKKNYYTFFLEITQNVAKEVDLKVDTGRYSLRKIFYKTLQLLKSAA